MKRILVHGHRGARARFPENTLPAFRHAMEAGADFLEMDVWVTRDDVVAVCHDPVLKRRRCRGCGPRLVRGMTFEELQGWDCGSARHARFPNQTLVPGTRVPSLDEVLALGSVGPIQFNIEVKTSPRRPEYAPEPPEYARLVVEAVRRRGLEDRVIVQSFDFRILREICELAPGIRRAALYQFGLRDFASVAREACAEIVAPHFRVATKRKVGAAHEQGLQVIPWTANRPRTWERLIRAGVDGIITDDPAGLVAYLRERSIR